MVIRTYLRRVFQPLLWRWYRYYNRRAHWVKADGLRLHIGPGVFHPRWFLTTRTLTDFALAHIAPQAKVLELGAGNGLLALSCSRAGAQVTASDLNPEAIKSLELSSQANQLALQVIHSDLFDQILRQDFDFIFINPPYFPKQPHNEQELAFFCGEDFAYFRKLFQQLSAFTSTQTFLILTDDCELDTIQELAREADHQLELVQQTTQWGEEHLVFKASFNGTRTAKSW